MEVMDSNKRLFLSNALFISWAVGYFLLASWAYLLRDWRHLQLCLSLLLLLNIPAVMYVEFFDHGRDVRWASWRIIAIVTVVVVFFNIITIHQHQHHHHTITTTATTTP